MRARSEFKVLATNNLFALATGGFVLLACGLCSCGPLRSSTNGLPLRAGMTVEELGRARPGEYSISLPFESLPSAREATAQVIATYHGNVLVRPKGAAAISIDYSQGVRADYGNGPLPHSSLEKRLPVGLSLTETLRRLRPDVDVRLGGFYDSHRSFVLPEEASKLKDYSGTAGRIGGGHTVEAKFKKGVVVEVEEYKVRSLRS